MVWKIIFEKLFYSKFFRASMIWIIGEYAERIDNADELLQSFLEGFHDENTQVLKNWPLWIISGENNAGKFYLTGSTSIIDGHREIIFKTTRRYARISSKRSSVGYSSKTTEFLSNFIRNGQKRFFRIATIRIYEIEDISIGDYCPPIRPPPRKLSWPKNRWSPKKPTF